MTVCDYKQSFPLNNLPSDLQYLIFQFSGTRVFPFALDTEFLGLMGKFYDYDLNRSFKYFNSVDASPIARRSWQEATLSIKNNSTKIKTTYLALKIMSESLISSDAAKIAEKWGVYSINIGRIKDTEQMILDRSLESIWNNYIVKSLTQNRPLELPTSADKIRTWLNDERNKKHIDQVDYIVLFNKFIPVIPPEINHFKNLKYLGIANCQLKDISEIKDMVSIKELGISENKIKDISYLKNLVNIERLDADHNEITDISSLAVLKNLFYLAINNNKIESINPLKANESLRYLRCGRNFITDFSFVNDKGFEELLGVDDYYNQHKNPSILNRIFSYFFDASL